MRIVPLVSAVLLLTLSTSALAAEWIDFTSRDDRFTCNFPGQPQVRQATFESEHHVALPARVYSVDDGGSHYAMTVVDYRDIERLHAEKAGACLQGTGDCRVNRGGVERWMQELAGAPNYATSQLLRRDAVVTYFGTSWMDWVEGQGLQLTNPDRSRTYASIYMHENKLYIMEGTVPDGPPEPALFQQSLGWIDENGASIRYRSIYRNGYPAPPRVNRGGQAP